jgi:UDP-N-acetylmuramoyl-L-alanyl-D-glutamate--2,6-diaminopimelate ligase
MNREVHVRTLGELLAGILDIPLTTAERQLVITGIYDDSRRVEAGGLFVAIPGHEQDGRQFIPDAVRRGATVVIGQQVEREVAPLVLNVADVRSVLARLAVRWYGLEHSAGGLTLVGVTGTNGKSTTACMTRSILSHAGLRCGLLGTVQYDLCGRTLEAGMTTPSPLELASYLRECLDRGGQAVVCEVSSHALDQRRTDGLRFAAAAFTNLTQDHLDYHLTIEAYREAKKRLFDLLDGEATAVVNRDDPHHQHMIRDCRARVLTYSLRGPADLTATITRDSIRGTVYRMRVLDRDLVLENALVGRHNVYNALAAAGLAAALGVPSEAIEAGLMAVRNIPGRLQRVMCLPGVEVFVDYAHTDDALRNVLGVLKPLAAGRLIVVFGCGGDRDAGKRPKMARAAVDLADLIFITSDNPRSEDPEAIIADIVRGLNAHEMRRVRIDADRRRAILAALREARAGDVVLIAGKGHETCQIIGKQKFHFDDVEVALQAAAELSRGPTPSAAP